MIELGFLVSNQEGVEQTAERGLVKSKVGVQEHTPTQNFIDPPGLVWQQKLGHKLHEKSGFPNTPFPLSLKWNRVLP